MKIGRRRASELQWRLDSMGTTQPYKVLPKSQARRKFDKVDKWVFLIWVGYILFCVASVLFTYNFFWGTP